MENKNLNETEIKNLEALENTEDCENGEKEAPAQATEQEAERANKKEKKQKKHRIKKFFKSRKTKRGSVAAAILAVFVCIILLVNTAAGLLVNRFPNLQFDLTASQTYQLQDDTVEYLSQLDSDVTVYVLTSENTFKGGLSAYSGSQYFVQAHKLLKKMAASSKNLTLKFVDLSSEPTFTSKYSNIDWSSEAAGNLILIDAGKDSYTALTIDDCFTYDSETYSYYGYYSYTGTTIEQAVITGILDVTTGEKVGIDFITGYGENEENYSALQNLLKQNAYEINDVNLTTEGFSNDAEIAFLYAPAVDLSEDAATKIQDWLDNDGERGHNLVYIPTDQAVDTPNLDSLLEEYGMKISDGIGFCTSSSYYVSSPYMFLTDYNNDTYTATLKNSGIPTIVYDSRTVEITAEDTASPLLSVDSSAGVIPFDADTSEIESAGDLDKYLQDSINLAAIGTKTNSDEKSSSVAVFGSYYMFYSDFLSTTSYNNANYVVNLCNTVTDRGDMGITITSASVDDGELGVTNAATTIAVGIIFIALVPLTVLVIGLIVYIRRRNR